jgi:hypothetical protein
MGQEVENVSDGNEEWVSTGDDNNGQLWCHSKGRVISTSGQMVPSTMEIS